MRIRPEETSDARAVRALNEAAFGSTQEAEIVEAVRNAPGALSLVGESDGVVVGHILFSPATLIGHPAIRLMGLGPMAVSPARQRTGIGSALVREGLDGCRHMPCSAVVVLGHPEYYVRFGFVPASRYGIVCEYEVPEEAFMLIELEPGSLQRVSGQVTYHEAFRDA